MVGTSAGAKKAAATRKNKANETQGNKTGQQQQRQLTDEERSKSELYSD